MSTSRVKKSLKKDRDDLGMDRFIVKLDAVTAGMLKHLVEASLSGTELKNGGKNEVITQAICELYEKSQKECDSLNIEHQKALILYNNAVYLKASNRDNYVDSLEKLVRIPKWRTESIKLRKWSIPGIKMLKTYLFERFCYSYLDESPIKAYKKICQ